MENRSEPDSDVMPVLVYRNPVEAATWLCEAFGFTLRLTAGNDHAQLTWGNSAILLTAARSEPARRSDPASSPELAGRLAPSGRFREPRANEVTSRIHLRVPDVAAALERALVGGARVVEAIETHPFGERQCTVSDPSGRQWTLSQTVEDVDPADWGAWMPEPVE
jgi:uncharacterized glyoxalase superfamily protein PhnB